MLKKIIYNSSILFFLLLNIEANSSQIYKINNDNNGFTHFGLSFFVWIILPFLGALLGALLEKLFTYIFKFKDDEEKKINN